MIVDMMVLKNSLGFPFLLQMSKNYNIVRFGMQRFKNDMSCVSAELIGVFTRSSRVFAQS
jgi:hypothetical protein